MIKIDTGEFCLIEPSEEYAEQIAEYKQVFLDNNCSMDGCGPLRRCEDPLTYIAECKIHISRNIARGLGFSNSVFLYQKG